MKCKVLVLTHGSLAQKLVETAQLILGDSTGIDYMNMPEDFDMEKYKNMITEIILDNQEGILILTDLLGGSPFLIASQIVCKYFDRVEIVSGCNMNMLLELRSHIENETIVELKKIAMDAGKNGIVDLKERLGNAQ